MQVEGVCLEVNCRLVDGVLEGKGCGAFLGLSLEWALLSELLIECSLSRKVIKDIKKISAEIRNILSIK